MDFVIEFFRDTLDGPFYIVWVVVLVILIFACIGYLAEKGINNKKEKEKYATVSDTDSVSSIQDTVSQETINDVQDMDTSTTVSVTELTDAAGVSPVQDISDLSSDNSKIGDVDSTIIQPNELSQIDNTGVPPTVVSPQIETTTEVVNSPSNDVNDVVIPTINQDGKDNAI